ncbi:SRPBCC family protein [Halorubellus sp. JP-L1]|uniref:SRPBCC family protein n=1 Tax=Halorubellus sp. JP-L1 TaxID=2715753 RepID=UPI001409A50A|nr:SRPBCC family protein [Halorubellus sp. JP-L1]NHN41486.1 SRPBCC family protein [Halorubellus sp. JP-L1]
MPTFEHTIEIAAPIDQVFAFNDDPKNWLRTNPSLVSVDVGEETDDGIWMDTTYRMLGMELDGGLTLRRVEPTEHIMTFENGGMSGDIHFEYAETPSGTTVVQRADYEFGDRLRDRIVAPVAKRYNKRQFSQSLELTKDLVEAEAKVAA